MIILLLLRSSIIAISICRIISFQHWLFLRASTSFTPHIKRRSCATFSRIIMFVIDFVVVVVGGGGGDNSDVPLSPFQSIAIRLFFLSSFFLLLLLSYGTMATFQELSLFWHISFCVHADAQLMFVRTSQMLHLCDIWNGFLSFQCPIEIGLAIFRRMKRHHIHKGHHGIEWAFIVNKFKMHLACVCVCFYCVVLCVRVSVGLCVWTCVCEFVFPLRII